MIDSVHTTTRLPKQLRVWFDARAKSEGVSTSELIRIALLDYRRSNENGNGKESNGKRKRASMP